MISWVFEEGTYESNQERFIKAVTDQGMDYKICNYVPFSGIQKIKGKRISETYPRKDIVYASIQPVDFIQKSEKYTTQTFCKFKQYDCGYYYPRFGKFLTQQEYLYFPFGELLRKKEWIFNTFGQGSLFIRPTNAYKTFSGQLTSEDSWEKDVEKMGFYDTTPETMCVLAAPQKIQKEWRIVIGSEYRAIANPLDVPQHIVTGSCYKENFKLLDEPREEVPDDVRKFVNEVLDNITYRPDPFWVMDIAETEDGLSVLEVGGFSCCGMYNCNIEQLVESISRYVQDEIDHLKQIDDVMFNDGLL